MDRMITTNVRIICARHRDLESLLEERKFRLQVPIA